VLFYLYPASQSGILARCFLQCCQSHENISKQTYMSQQFNLLNKSMDLYQTRWEWFLVTGFLPVHMVRYLNFVHWINSLLVYETDVTIIAN